MKRKQRERNSVQQRATGNILVHKKRQTSKDESTSSEENDEIAPKSNSKFSEDKEIKVVKRQRCMVILSSSSSPQSDNSTRNVNVPEEWDAKRHKIQERAETSQEGVKKQDETNKVFESDSLLDSLLQKIIQKTPKSILTRRRKPSHGGKYKVYDVEKRVWKRVPHSDGARVGDEKRAILSGLSKRECKSVFVKASASNKAPSTTLEPIKKSRFLSSQSRLAKRKRTAFKLNRDADFDFSFGQFSDEVTSSNEPSLSKNVQGQDTSSSKRESSVNKKADSAVDIKLSKPRLVERKRNEDHDLSVSQSLPEMKLTVVEKESSQGQPYESISPRPSDRNQMEELHLISSSSRESVVVYKESKFEQEKPVSNQNGDLDLPSYCNLVSPCRKSLTFNRLQSTSSNNKVTDVRKISSKTFPQNNQIENPQSRRKSHAVVTQSDSASNVSKSHYRFFKVNSTGDFKKNLSSNSSRSKRKNSKALFLSLASRRKCRNASGIFHERDPAKQQISFNSSCQDRNKNNKVNFSDSASLTEVKILDSSYQTVSSNSSRTEQNRKSDFHLISPRLESIRRKLTEIIQEPNSSSLLVSSKSQNSALIENRESPDDKAVESGSNSNATYCSKCPDSEFMVCAIEALNDNQFEDKELLIDSAKNDSLDNTDLPESIAGTLVQPKDERINSSAHNVSLNIAEDYPTNHNTDESTGLNFVQLKKYHENEQLNYELNAKLSCVGLNEFSKDRLNDFTKDLTGVTDILTEPERTQSNCHTEEFPKNEYRSCSARPGVSTVRDLQESLKDWMQTKSLSSKTTYLKTTPKQNSRIRSTTQGYIDKTFLKRSNCAHSETITVNDATISNVNARREAVRPGSKNKSDGLKVPKAKKTSFLSCKLQGCVDGFEKSENYLISEVDKGNPLLTFPSICIPEVPCKTYSESDDEWFGDLNLYSRRSKSTLDPKRVGLIINDLTEFAAKDCPNAKLPSLIKHRNPAVTSKTSGNTTMKLPKIPPKTALLVPSSKTINGEATSLVRKKAVRSNYEDSKLASPSLLVKTTTRFIKKAALGDLDTKNAQVEKISAKRVLSGKTSLRRRQTRDSKAKSDRNNSYGTCTSVESEFSNSAFLESLVNEASIESVRNKASVGNLVGEATMETLLIKDFSKDVSLQSLTYHASLNNLDCKKATLNDLDCKKATLNDLNSKKASLDKLDCKEESLINLDCKEGLLNNLDGKEALLKNLHSKQSSLDSLDSSKATLKRLGSKKALSLHSLSSKKLPVKRPNRHLDTKKTNENVRNFKTKISSKSSQTVAKSSGQNVLKNVTDGRTSIKNLIKITYKIPKIKTTVPTNILEPKSKTLDINIKAAWAELPKMYGIGHNANDKKAPADEIITADDTSGNAVQNNTKCQNCPGSNKKEESAAENNKKESTMDESSAENISYAESSAENISYAESSAENISYGETTAKHISDDENTAENISKDESTAANNKTDENTSANNRTNENIAENISTDKSTAANRTEFPVGINTPDENTAEINTPDENTAEINTPDENTAEINTPDENTAEINTPDENTAEINTPDENTAEINTPDENTAEINTPDENTAEINTPDENTAEMNRIDENTAENNKAVENTATNNRTHENTATNNRTHENTATNNRTHENTATNNRTHENTAENNTVEENTAENNTVEENPAENNTVEENPAENNTVEENPAENNTVEENPAENNTVEENPAENNTVEENTPENNTVDGNTVENNMTDGNTVENNMTDGNTVENNMTDENTANTKMMSQNDGHENTANTKMMSQNDAHENTANTKMMSQNDAHENTANTKMMSQNDAHENTANTKMMSQNDGHENTANTKMMSQNDKHENTAKSNQTNEASAESNKRYENIAKSNSIAENNTTWEKCNEINSINAQSGERKLPHENAIIIKYTDKSTSEKIIPEGKLVPGSKMNGASSTKTKSNDLFPSQSQENYRSTSNTVNTVQNTTAESCKFVETSEKRKHIDVFVSGNRTSSDKTLLTKRIKKSKTFNEGKIETEFGEFVKNEAPLKCSTATQRIPLHGKRTVKNVNSIPATKGKIITLVKSAGTSSVVKNKSDTLEEVMEVSKSIVRKKQVAPGNETEGEKAVVKEEFVKPNIENKVITPQIKRENSKSIIKNELVMSGIKTEVESAVMKEEFVKPNIENERVTLQIKWENSTFIGKNKRVMPGIKIEDERVVVKEESETPNIDNELVMSEVKRENSKPIIKNEHVKMEVVEGESVTKPLVKIETVSSEIDIVNARPIIKNVPVTTGIKREDAEPVIQIESVTVKGEKYTIKKDPVTPGVQGNGTRPELVRSDGPNSIVKNEPVTPGVKGESARPVKRQNVKPILKNEPVTTGVKRKVVIPVKQEGANPIMMNDLVTPGVKREDIKLVKRKFIKPIVKNKPVTTRVNREGPNIDRESFRRVIKHEPDKLETERGDTTSDATVEFSTAVLKNNSTAVKREGARLVVENVYDTSAIKRECAKPDKKNDSVMQQQKTDGANTIIVHKRKSVRPVAMEEGVNKKEHATLRLKNETVSTAVVNNKVVTPVVNNDVITAVAKNETISKVVKKEVVALVVKKEVVAPVVKKEVVAPVVKEEVVAPVVKEEVVAPVVKEEVVAPVVKKEVVAPVVKKEVVAPVVKKEVVAPVVKKEVVAPVVKKEVVAPVVKKEVVAPVVKKEVVAPVVKKEVVAPVVKKEVVAPVVKKDLDADDEVKPLMKIEIDQCARSVVKNNVLPVVKNCKGNDVSVPNGSGSTLKPHQSTHSRKSDDHDISRKNLVRSPCAMDKLSSTSEAEPSLLSLPLIEQPYPVSLISKYGYLTANLQDNITARSYATEDGGNEVTYKDILPETGSNIIGDDSDSDSVVNLEIAKDNVDESKVVTDVSTISRTRFVKLDDVSKIEESGKVAGLFVKTPGKHYETLKRPSLELPSNNDDVQSSKSNNFSQIVILGDVSKSDGNEPTNDNKSKRCFNDSAPKNSSKNFLTKISIEKSKVSVSSTEKPKTTKISSEEFKAQHVIEESTMPIMSRGEFQTVEISNEKSTEQTTEKNATTIENYEEKSTTSVPFKYQNPTTPTINKNQLSRNCETSKSPGRHREYSRSDRHDRDYYTSSDRYRGYSSSPWRHREIPRSTINYQQSCRSRYGDEFSRDPRIDQVYSNPPRGARGHWRPPRIARGGWIPPRIWRGYSRAIRGGHECSGSSRGGFNDGQNSWRQPLDINPEFEISQQWLSSHGCPVDTNWKYGDTY